jgi:tetratricopeptide (TPR) repeat protein
MTAHLIPLLFLFTSSAVQASTSGLASDLNPILTAQTRLLVPVGDPDAGVAYLLAALEADPSNPRPLLVLGDIARRGGHNDLAVQYYGLALLLEPGMVEPAVWVSRQLADAGRMADALQTLDRALFAKPESLSLLLAKGHLHLENQDSESALAHLTEAAALAPMSFEAHQLLGLASLKLHRWAEAEHAYRRALSIRDDPQVHVELALVYHESGVAPERALDHLQYVLEQDGGYVPALSTAADVLLEQGKPQAAKGLWAEAIRIDSTYCPALNNAGRLQMEQGRLPQAIAAFDQCLATQPDYLPAVLNRGLAHGKLGQCTGAHRDLDPLIETGGEVGALATEMMGDCHFPFHEQSNLHGEAS